MRVCVRACVRFAKALWSISVYRDDNSPDMEKGMHYSMNIKFHFIKLLIITSSNWRNLQLGEGRFLWSRSRLKYFSDRMFLHASVLQMSQI
jgi:hypothetical protein